jgi:hypothetical protein
MALDIPDFASEREEAVWWYDHRDEVSDEMAEAVANGTIRSVRQMLLEDHNLVFADAYLSLPMSAEDMSVLRRIAESQGLEVDELMSKVLTDFLHQAQQAA